MKRALLLLAVLAAAWQAATAYDFMADGIAYNINSDSISVSVTYTKLVENNYSDIDSISIPTKVMTNGINYDVTKIGMGAFRYSPLKYIEIPNSVTIIDNGAFIGCN